MATTPPGFPGVLLCEHNFKMSCSLISAPNYGEHRAETQQICLWGFALQCGKPKGAGVGESAPQVAAAPGKYFYQPPGFARRSEPNGIVRDLSRTAL